MDFSLLGAMHLPKENEFCNLPVVRLRITWANPSNLPQPFKCHPFDGFDVLSEMWSSHH